MVGRGTEPTISLVIDRCTQPHLRFLGLGPLSCYYLKTRQKPIFQISNRSRNGEQNIFPLETSFRRTDHHLFKKMPKRDSTISTVVPSTACRRSPRFLHGGTSQQDPPTLRRSSRLSHRRKNSPESEAPKSPEPKSSQAEKSSKSLDWSRNCGISSTGSKSSGILRRSPRFSVQDSKKSGVSANGSNNRGNLSTELVKCRRKNNAVAGFQSLRRSQRILRIGRQKCYMEELSDTEEAQSFVAKGKRETRKVSVGPDTEIGERGAEEELARECAVVEASRKRKRDECEESNEAVQGWTKEQELALQRAYLVAKPTPHFWKKVSKLVPGKSAQDCFDKVNSDYLTPHQNQRVSRVKKRRNSSPISHLPLSASKVLKPMETKVKLPSFNKQKSHILHKNVRHLLQMHHHQNQDREADLFSVLEPNLDLSTQAFQNGVVLSTPKQLQQQHGFLQKFDERSSSGHKKPLSRFSGSRGKALPSPFVLKPVKNKVLHEKYIDQLHGRDAKRKAASEQAKKSTLRTGDGKENNVPKLDAVRAAKNALVSDAVSILHHIQTNARSNSSDLDDDDVFRSEGDESETEI